MIPSAAAAGQSRAGRPRFSQFLLRPGAL